MKKIYYLFLPIATVVVCGLMSIMGAAESELSKVRTSFAKITPEIERLVDQAISYSKENHVFPNAYQLKLSTAPGEQYVTNPTALSPYFGGIALTDDRRDGLNLVDISEPKPCGAKGVIASSLDVELLGFPTEFADNSADNGFECFYWHYEGKIYSQCFYGFGTANGSQTGDIIPGWININTTHNWDWNGEHTFNQNGFRHPTCQ